MKKYRDIAFCTAFNSGIFLDKLNKTIDDFQKQGLEVEVQYSPTSGQLTALVFSYTNN